MVIGLTRELQSPIASIRPEHDTFGGYQSPKYDVSPDRERYNHTISGGGCGNNACLARTNNTGNENLTTLTTKGLRNITRERRSDPKQNRLARSHSMNHEEFVKKSCGKHNFGDCQVHRNASSSSARADFHLRGSNHNKVLHSTPKVPDLSIMNDVKEVMKCLRSPEEGCARNQRSGIRDLSESSMQSRGGSTDRSMALRNNEESELVPQSFNIMEMGSMSSDGVAPSINRQLFDDVKRRGESKRQWQSAEEIEAAITEKKVDETKKRDVPNIEEPTSFPSVTDVQTTPTSTPVPPKRTDIPKRTLKDSFGPFGGHRTSTDTSTTKNDEKKNDRPDSPNSSEGAGIISELRDKIFHRTPNTDTDDEAKKTENKKDPPQTNDDPSPNGTLNIRERILKFQGIVNNAAKNLPKPTAVVRPMSRSTPLTNTSETPAVEDRSAMGFINRTIASIAQEGARGLARLRDHSDTNGDSRDQKAENAKKVEEEKKTEEKKPEENKTPPKAKLQGGSTNFESIKDEQRPISKRRFKTLPDTAAPQQVPTSNKCYRSDQPISIANTSIHCSDVDHRQQTKGNMRIVEHQGTTTGTTTGSNSDTPWLNLHQEIAEDTSDYRRRSGIYKNIESVIQLDGSDVEIIDEVESPIYSISSGKRTANSRASPPEKQQSNPQQPVVIHSVESEDDVPHANAANYRSHSPYRQEEGPSQQSRQQHHRPSHQSPFSRNYFPQQHANQNILDHGKAMEMNSNGATLQQHYHQNYQAGGNHRDAYTSSGESGMDYTNQGMTTTSSAGMDPMRPKFVTASEVGGQLDSTNCDTLLNAFHMGPKYQRPECHGLAGGAEPDQFSSDTDSANSYQLNKLLNTVLTPAVSTSTDSTGVQPNMFEKKYANNFSRKRSFQSYPLESEDDEMSYMDQRQGKEFLMNKFVTKPKMCFQSFLDGHQPSVEQQSDVEELSSVTEGSNGSQPMMFFYSMSPTISDGCPELVVNIKLKEGDRPGSPSNMSESTMTSSMTNQSSITTDSISWSLEPAANKHQPTGPQKGSGCKINRKLITQILANIMEEHDVDDLLTPSEAKSLATVSTPSMLCSPLSIRF